VEETVELEIGEAPGLHVAARTRGERVPVLLVHGYASSHADWATTGWTDALEAAARGWIAPDLRGHGRSEKPWEPSAYAVSEHVGDLARVLDAAGADRADVVGYSLGGELALEFALAHPERVRSLVVGGIGDRRPHSAEDAAALFEQVVAGSEPPESGPARLWSRASARPGNDRVALAACLAGVSGSPPMRGLDRYGGPVLLFAGADDGIAEGIARLREQLEAELLLIEGCNHGSAMSAPLARARSVTFLASQR
jgi:pimeloyl-ACP methyl ester carboxylesterase